nr:MAG TPA: Matrix protein 2 design, M2, VIRAL PROTEIN [Caudoviricetes sp.]
MLRPFSAQILNNSQEMVSIFSFLSILHLALFVVVRLLYVVFSTLSIPIC